MRIVGIACLTIMQLVISLPSIPVPGASPHILMNGGESEEITRLCAKIVEIKRLPLKREEGGLEFFKALDPVYGQFRELGDAMVPCLISKVTDENVMDDPSQAPHYGLVTVGDVAFWVFLDITGMPFEKALPPPVRKDYESRGYFAYFDWVRESPAHRTILQKNIEHWYAKRAKQKSRGKGTTSACNR